MYKNKCSVINCVVILLIRIMRHLYFKGSHGLNDQNEFQSKCLYFIYEKRGPYVIYEKQVILVGSMPVLTNYPLHDQYHSLENDIAR